MPRQKSPAPPPAPKAARRHTLGLGLRAVRRQQGLTLQQVSDLTGLSVSTLSKVENNQLSLTYDKLMSLAEGLRLDPAELLRGEPARAGGRRAVSRQHEGRVIDTPNYRYIYICNDLSQKRMLPVVTHIKAHTRAEFGELLRHGGEELIYVLSGAIEVHTDLYEPLLLRAGDAVYIDSHMGHAYVAAGDQEAVVLGVMSASDLGRNGSGQEPWLPDDAATPAPTRQPRTGQSRTGQSRTGPPHTGQPRTRPPRAGRRRPDAEAD